MPTGREGWYITMKESDEIRKRISELEGFANRIGVFVVVFFAIFLIYAGFIAR